MKNLKHKDLSETVVNEFKSNKDKPSKGTLGGRPSLNFDTNAHSFMYHSVEDRDNDFNIVNTLY